MNAILLTTCIAVWTFLPTGQVKHSLPFDTSRPHESSALDRLMKDITAHSQPYINAPNWIANPRKVCEGDHDYVILIAPESKP